MAEKTKQKDDSFTWTVNIGRLDPAQSVTIETTFVTELQADALQRTLLFKLNQSLLPFITPTEDVGVPIVTPLGVLHSGETLFSIDVCMPHPIESMTSASHDQTLRILNSSETQSSITVSMNSGNMVTDFSLAIKLREFPVPIVSVERHNAPTIPEFEYVAAVTIAPAIEKAESEEPTVNTEFIFLLDCSGSMSGSPIELSFFMVIFLFMQGLLI